jgi:proteic killer suppression protein
VIVSFRDAWLHEFFVDEDRLFRKLQLIDDATTDRDLRSPPDSSRGEAKDLYLDDHSYR